MPSTSPLGRAHERPKVVACEASANDGRDGNAGGDLNKGDDGEGGGPARAGQWPGNGTAMARKTEDSDERQRPRSGKTSLTWAVAIGAGDRDRTGTISLEG